MHAAIKIREPIYDDGIREDDSETPYTLSDIFSPRLITKQLACFKLFTDMIRKFGPDNLNGPILDLGCGYGQFVFIALVKGLDCWGVDHSEKGIRLFHEMIDHKNRPRPWKNRYRLADVQDLPFENDFFSAIFSWYVLEHVTRLGPTLREAVRVTRPGGIIYLVAQDARNCWEGHCRIPWPPFLPDRLARVWAEVFEVDYSKRGNVYEYTEPQVRSILEALGCRIKLIGPAAANLIPNHWQWRTEDEVRTEARKYKKVFDEGKWIKQPENLHILAEKG